MDISDKSNKLKSLEMAKKRTLNDLIYSFEPLQIITPDSNHQVDETQLQKSIQKSKEMMAVIEEYKRKRAVSNS